MGNFNENLRLLRKKNDMTQAELGKRLRISTSSVAMYEQGEREPNFKTLKNIGSFFKVDMNFLLGVDNDENTKVYSSILKNEVQENVRIENTIYYMDKDMKFLFDHPKHKMLSDSIKYVKDEDVDFIQDMFNKLNR